MQDPFSQRQLEYLFLTRPGTDICHRREGMSVEYRENFHLSIEAFAKTARTMAAYANNRGGYIIFGVTDRPHTLKGMTNDKFQNDPNRLNQFLISHFQPTIRWDLYTHHIGEKKFGLIYVYEAPRKPIVAMSNFDGQYREGEILYRYVSESKAIKAADLIALIESRVEKERRDWQNMLSKMATVTPQNALLMNTATGKMDSDGNTFVVDSSLLKQIKWIKEGHFRENQGAPALKLIGNVQTLSGQPVIATATVPRAITKDDIVQSFLSSECFEPREYLRAIPYTNIALLPIWFFIHHAELSTDVVSDLIKECATAGKTCKANLLSRLTTDNAEKFRSTRIPRLGDIPQFDYVDFDEAVELWHNGLSPKPHLIGCKKAALLAELLAGRAAAWPDSFWQEHANILFQTVTWLEKDFISDNASMLRRLVSSAMAGVEQTANTVTLYRKALCYLDYVLYFQCD